jgi:type IV pilus assembly protein PilE
MTYLSDYGVKMEQYYQDNRNYGTGGAGAACADGAGAPSWNTFAPAGAKFFNFTCVLGADNQSYVLTATGSGNRTTGYDYQFSSVNSAKSTIKFNGSVVAKACWATQASDC